MIILLAVLLASAALVAYSKFEKRINQRACPECGYTVSVDAVEEQCPSCDLIFGEEAEDRIGLASRAAH
ncbi:MAG TPA: hypothetical protein VJZ26_02510 [Blastocatellia bacterium]|nr:hypothetical protein [Blastocatellia bacterium]